MSKLRYTDVKKALEHCSDGTGKGIIQSAIDLMDHQQAEIERLQKALVLSRETTVHTRECAKRIVELNKSLVSALQSAKSDAVAEFANKLLRRAILENDGSFTNGYIRLSDFYEILSDMEAKYES